MVRTLLYALVLWSSVLPLALGGVTKTRTDTLSQFAGKRQCKIENQISSLYNQAVKAKGIAGGEQLHWVLSFDTYPKFERGTGVTIRHWSGVMDQRWYFDNDGHILSEYNDYAIDIQDGSLDPGAKVHMWAKHNGENQQWGLDKEGYLYSKMDGTDVVMETVVDEQGKPLYIRTGAPKGAAYQKWSVVCDV